MISDEEMMKEDQEKFNLLSDGTFFSAYLKKDLEMQKLEDNFEEFTRRYFVVKGKYPSSVVVIEINSDNISNILKRSRLFWEEAYRLEDLQGIEVLVRPY